MDNYYYILCPHTDIIIYILCPGADILRLTRDDLIELCGLSDGIRMNHMLHNRYVITLHNTIHNSYLLILCLYSIDIY